MREYLTDGGRLVRVFGGAGLAVEGVPGAHRGLVVHSSLVCVSGERRYVAKYRLTQRAVGGTDLWRVRRAGTIDV